MADSIREHIVAAVGARELLDVPPLQAGPLVLVVLAGTVAANPVERRMPSGDEVTVRPRSRS